MAQAMAREFDGQQAARLEAMRVHVFDPALQAEIDVVVAEIQATHRQAIGR
jgi:hypothetical protein